MNKYEWCSESNLALRIQVVKTLMQLQSVATIQHCNVQVHSFGCVKLCNVFFYAGTNAAAGMGNVQVNVISVTL